MIDPLGRFADPVAEVQAGAGCVYAWVIAAGQHRLIRLDLSTGMVDHWLAVGPIVDWAVSPEGGVLVVDWFLGAQRLLVLSPLLAIRLTVPLNVSGASRVFVSGQHGWVVAPLQPPVGVGNAQGLPWGALSDVDILAVDLWATSPHGVRPVGRRANAAWFVNEDGVTRRLIDQATASSVVPNVLPSDHALAVSLGRFAHDPGPIGAPTQRRIWRLAQMPPAQDALYISPVSGVRTVIRLQPPWIHQVAQAAGQFLTASSAGAEIGPPGQGVLVLARPPSGLVRWIVAGSAAYCLSMDQTVPLRGLHLFALVLGRLEPVFSDPAASLLGHPASAERLETFSAVADGEALLLPITVDGLRTRLLRLTGSGASLVHEAEGWLEPIQRDGDDIIVLHSPTSVPGVRRSGPGWMQRLHSPAR